MIQMNCDELFEQKTPKEQAIIVSTPLKASAKVPRNSLPFLYKHFV